MPRLFREVAHSPELRERGKSSRPGFPDRARVRLEPRRHFLRRATEFLFPYRNAELPDGPEGEYLPDRLVDETIRFAKANKDRPWMAHLWFYTVHWPMQAPKELLEKYADRKGPGLKDTRYGAMIEAMDLAIGRLLKALEKMGMEKDTLVIFTSDNGGFAGVSDCRPLRESKGHLYEGGHPDTPDRSLARSGSSGKALQHPGHQHGLLPHLPRDGRVETEWQTDRWREPSSPIQANGKTHPQNNLFPFPQLRLAHGQPLGRGGTGRKMENNPQLRRWFPRTL